MNLIAETLTNITFVGHAQTCSTIKHELKLIMHVN